jgi:hypothetical protein
MQVDNIRTSDGMFFDRAEDPVIRGALLALLLRLAAALLHLAAAPAAGRCTWLLHCCWLLVALLLAAALLNCCWPLHVAAAQLLAGARLALEQRRRLAACLGCQSWCRCHCDMPLCGTSAVCSAATTTIPRSTTCPARPRLPLGPDGAAALPVNPAAAAAIEKRLAEWTLLPVHYGEGLQVLRYKKSQKYDAVGCACACTGPAAAAAAAAACCGCGCCGGEEAMLYTLLRHGAELRPTCSCCGDRHSTQAASLPAALGPQLQ